MDFLIYFASRIFFCKIHQMWQKWTSSVKNVLITLFQFLHILISFGHKLRKESTLFFVNLVKLTSKFRDGVDMRRLGLKTDWQTLKITCIGWGKKCRWTLAWVNMLNAQEMVVGMVRGKLTLPNLYYVLLATLLAIQQGQIVNLASTRWSRHHPASSQRTVSGRSGKS